jgi:hypothetical protein
MNKYNRLRAILPTNTNPLARLVQVDGTIAEMDLGHLSGTPERGGLPVQCLDENAADTICHHLPIVRRLAAVDHQNVVSKNRRAPVYRWH